ncbi:conserved hypothetical protein [Vibrio chagasii]|nr:conserved hypothetical protein [Vibrio chagasii]
MSQSPQKSQAATKVLQLMDSCEDGDGRYTEFVNEVVAELGVSKEELEKELDLYI